ncbi:ArnT family glycosyltransferase [Patescibacteria group bacterium]
MKKKENFFHCHWPFLLSFLLFYLLRLPSLFEPFTYGDEGIYLVLGQALRKGLTFYKDIHDNKPPLIYLVAALAGTFKKYRVIYFLWSEIGFILFAKLTKKIHPQRKVASAVSLFAFAILASIPLFEGTIANAENFLIYTSIAGLWLLLTWPEKKFAFFAAGLLFALSVLFKVPAITDFGTALLVFFLFAIQSFSTIKKVFQDKRLYFLISGFILPIFLSFLYYYSQHALTPYFKAAFAQNLPYLSSWKSSQSQALSLPTPLLLRGFGLLTMIIFLWFNKNKIKPQAKLVIIWFCSGLFAALLSSRPYPHYLLQIIPAACLALGFLFSSQKTLRAIPLIFSFLVMVVFIRFDYYHYPTTTYYQNFYQFALGKKSFDQYLSFWGEHVSSLYQTANFIRERTQPQEKIFIWGDQPSLYALAERLPTGRYASAYHIKDFDQGYKQTLLALEKNPPRYFLVFRNQESSLEILKSFLTKNYTFRRSSREIDIYYYSKH